MGAMDRVRAAAREAAARGRAAADAAVARASEIDGSLAAQGPAREAATRLAALGEHQRMRHAELLARAGASATGAALGERVRAFGRVAGRLPLLSVPTDLFAERNAVEALGAAVQADPHDVLAHLWLGEALLAMQADARRFAQFRAVIDPASFVVREAVRTAAALGATPSDPAAQVLARCRYLAATALRRDPRTGVALYALARVELATGRPDLAVQPAKLAVAASAGADRGRALVVLARAYLALGRDASAANVAQQAVTAGCSLGWEVLAELLYRADTPGEDDGTPRHRRYVELRSRVTEDDRRAYHGAQRSSAQIGRSVLDAQRRRARELGEAAARRVPGQAARDRTVPITPAPPATSSP